MCEHGRRCTEQRVEDLPTKRKKKVRERLAEDMPTKVEREEEMGREETHGKKMNEKKEKEEEKWCKFFPKNATFVQRVQLSSKQL